jgi:nucleoside 2-deoxyribosyltransferase
VRSIYLASPLGFAESTRPFMADLVARLRGHLVVHNPWDETTVTAPFAEIMALDSIAERDQRLAEINRTLGRLNAEAIDASDGLFAILDGVDVDSGTAAEIGYAFALGKYVCGLRTDFRLAGDNPGSIVNLQVEYFILASGGSIVTTAGALIDLARDLATASTPAVR